MFSYVHHAIIDSVAQGTQRMVNPGLVLRIVLVDCLEV